MSATGSVRGPWTPSTWSNSMWLVGDGLLIQVSGRPTETAAVSRATASGTTP